MKFLAAIIIGLCILQPILIKAELSIVAHDIECPIADPRHFTDIEVYVLDDGEDNVFFINFTIIKSLPDETMGQLTLWAASMGDYVVPTGIDFSGPICEARKEPIFSKRLYKALGATNGCPSPPVSPEEASTIEQKTRQQSQNKMWHSERSIRITGSHVSNICKFRYRRVEVKYAKDILFPKQLLSAATERGHSIENIAIEAYESTSQNAFQRCGFFISSEYPYIGASPDGLIGNLTVLEVECSQ